MVKSLPEDRSQGIVIERARLFDSEDDANRALFLRRVGLRRAAKAKARLAADGAFRD
jgi:translation elongation factor EF-Ts